MKNLVGSKTALVAVAAVGLFGAVPPTAYASYGQQATVTNGSTVPTGWVIIRVLPTTNQWIIEDLTGAPYQSQVEVINGSPVPAGWVITQVLASNSDWIIEDLVGAPYQNQVEVINGSPVPAGWVKTQVLANSDWIIENLNPSSPTANFTFNVNGLVANFTDTSSDPGGVIGSHSWTFGDGQSSTATNPSHTYAASGTYAVSETVTNQAGSANTKSESVTVSSGGTVTASFTFKVNGLIAYFTDTSTDQGGAIGSHLWTFGDGQSSTATNPSHAYAAGGAYTVSEKITDAYGTSTNTTSQAITVSQTYNWLTPVISLLFN